VCKFAVGRILLVFGVLLFLAAQSLAQAAAHTSPFAITHVTVIDPASGKSLPDMTVVVRGGNIESVTPSRQLKLPASITVVPGKGMFIIPGLWDMHVHFRDTERDLKMEVANGVLGIRNMGGAAKDVFPVRDAITAGQRMGPKIVAAGPIVDGPNSWSNPEFTVSVKTADEARAMVRSLKQRGSDFIKTYDNLARDAYFAIADETKKLGMPFAGHVPIAITIREASNAGQRSFEHGFGVLRGVSIAEAEYIKQASDQSVFAEAMQTKKFSLIPAKIARDDSAMLDHFSQEYADETYRLLAKNGTFITPTFVAQRSLTFIDDLDKKGDPRTLYVSADELNWWKPENGMLTKYRTPEYIAVRKREYAMLMTQFHRAHTLGVRFLAGTDVTIPYTFPGFSLHDELKLFVEAGFSPLEALQTATTNPALLLGLDKSWGRIAKGCTANLVLLRANPLTDISNTEKIDSVVAHGKLLSRAQLDQILGESQVRSASAMKVK
jgi:imidazolonepropionase-like amidohydrolase